MYRYQKPPPCQEFQNLKTNVGPSPSSLLMILSLQALHLSILSKHPSQLTVYDPTLDPHDQHEFGSKGLLDTPTDVMVLVLESSY